MTLPLQRAMAAVALLLLTVTLSAGTPAVQRLSEVDMPDSRLGGLWQFGADGAVFEIVPTAVADSYELFIVDSPDFSVAPGSFFGTISHTGKGNYYEAVLLLSPEGKVRGAARRKTRNYIFEFNDEGTQLSMRNYRKGFGVNLLRALPYLVRISVNRQDDRPQDVDGARRLAPASDDKYTVL